MALRSDDKFIVIKTTGGEKQEAVALSELDTYISSGEDSRLTALETTINAETTGLVPVVAGLQAIAQTAKAGTPVAPVAANAILTASGALSDGNTATVNDQVYTFRTALTTDPSTVPNEILIGASKEASMENLKKAINAEATEGTEYSTDTIQPTDVTATIDGAIVTCTAGHAGTAANAYPKAATGANLDWDGVGLTFSNGINGTAGVAGAMLYDATHLYYSNGISTVAVSNWKTITVDGA